MVGNLLSYGLQYGCYLIEVGLIIFVAQSSYRSRSACVILYLTSLLTAGLGRTYALYTFGVRSDQYRDAYWTTDFLLVISAFFLLCVFFRRACVCHEKLWRYIRLLLTFIIVLVVGISGACFSHNYGLLLDDFVVEFNQNLYFTCLVLNTLLYLLLQHIQSADDQLGLLVCGMGIQFAGPAATLALIHLTGWEGFPEALNSLAMRLCSLGMLLVWAYAIVHVRDKVTSVTGRKIPALAGVTANVNA